MQDISNTDLSRVVGGKGTYVQQGDTSMYIVGGVAATIPRNGTHKCDKALADMHRWMRWAVGPIRPDLPDSGYQVKIQDAADAARAACGRGTVTTY
jgi:hypothetical protein